MSITITTIIPLGHNRYQVTVTSSLGAGTTIYWRSSGGWEHRGLETVVEVPGLNGETFEVSDVAFTDDPYPGYAILQIFIDETDDVTQARFEEFYAAEWVVRELRTLDGSGWYQFRSRFLEDVTTHQFRVTLLDAIGNESAVTTLNEFMVRVPDDPDLRFTYDSGTGKVTVSADT